MDKLAKENGVQWYVLRTQEDDVLKKALTFEVDNGEIEEDLGRLGKSKWKKKLRRFDLLNEDAQHQ